MEKQKEYGVISRNTTHTHTHRLTHTQNDLHYLNQCRAATQRPKSIILCCSKHCETHKYTDAHARTHTHRLQHTKQLQSKKSHRHGCTYTLAHSLLEKDIYSLVSVNRRESKDNLNTHIQPCRERSISCTVYVVCTRGTV